MDLRHLAFLKFMVWIKVIFDTTDLCTFIINEFNPTFEVQRNRKVKMGLPKIPCFHTVVIKPELLSGWGIVACPVIQAIGRPDLEDFLRTRSPGEVIVGLLSVRTSSEITLVSILGQCDL